MSRLTEASFDYNPDDLPDPWAEPNADDLPPRKQRRWVQEDVYAYREALVRLGLDSRAIEDTIERDCGSEFCERPMLSVRQA